MKQTVRKLFGIIGAVCMAAAMLVSVPQEAKAAVNVSLSATPASTTVSKDETFSITFTYSSDQPDVRAFKATTSWDETALEVQGLPSVSGTGDATVINRDGKVVQAAIISMDPDVSMPASGSITYTFKALKDCSSPATAVSMNMEIKVFTTDNEYAYPSASTSVSFAHSGTPVAEDKAATCTEAGYHKETCPTCNTVLADETIAALGHDDGTWTVVTEATCATPGKKELHCTRCNALISEEVIPATGNHTFEWKVVKEATCAEKGSRIGICSVCGLEKTEEIAATGKHTVSDWEITKEATCTEKGSKTGMCSVCKQEITEEIAALGHTWKVDDTTDENGWKVVKEATTEEEGSKERECEVCGEKETEAIPKLSETETTSTTTPTPTSTSTTTKTSGTSMSSKTTPNTGDTTTATAAIILGAAAVCGILGLRAYKKRR